MTDVVVPRLLLIEPDDKTAEAHANVLSSGGFLVTRISSFDAPLDEITRVRADIAVIGSSPDGESSFHLSRQLKEHADLAWMPLICMMPGGDAVSDEKISLAKADEFIVTPARSEELLVRAKVLLRKSRDAWRIFENTRKLEQKVAERDDELDDLLGFAHDIVSSLSSAIMVLDENETVLFANAPFLSTIQSERKSVVQHKIGEFFRDPAGRETLSNAVKLVVSSGLPSRLHRLRDLFRGQNGTMSDVTVTAIDYAGARQVLVVVEDVSDQSLAEAEVLLERQKLADVVNAMNAALCLIDRDCNVVWKNRTFGLWFGDSFGQPGLAAFVSNLKSNDDWIEQVYGRGQILQNGWSVFTPQGQRRHFSNILARIKAVGSEANQALVLTQDVTEQETRVEQLSLLRELSQFLQGTLDAERLNHVILLCCTTGHALGFNRAFLFTRNRQTNTLDAQMAVGPASREDAFRIWAEISAQERSLHELLRGLEKLPAKESMSLYPRIKNLHYSMEDSSEIVVRTALEKKEQVVTDGNRDPRVTSGFREIFGCPEFVSVPLIVKGSVVGVILADNLYSGRAITDDHVKLLTLFAAQAALAIENAETYKELQRSLERLQQAQKQMVHTEKLATIGKMAAHVAHEIRNPLSTIGGFARAISRKPDNVERVNKNAKIIADETTRLENMLKGVMDFSRPAAPVPKNVDFNMIVERAFRTQAEYLSQHNIHSSIDLDRSIPEAMLDENQVLQVIHNMIRNSAESMPQGGALSLKTGREGDWVWVSIVDTGAGIAPGVLDRLFDPFFTTKPDGTGLGLAVSKKIIDDHGGKIEVHSEVGKGTTFKIMLPVRAKVLTEDAAASGEKRESTRETVISAR